MGQASGVNSVVFEMGRCFVAVRLMISACMSFSTWRSKMQFISESKYACLPACAGVHVGQPCLQKSIANSVKHCVTLCHVVSLSQHTQQCRCSTFCCLLTLARALQSPWLFGSVCRQSDTVGIPEFQPVWTCGLEVTGNFNCPAGENNIPV